MSFVEKPKNVFPGNSDVASLMRSLDWSGTSLGSPENWPEQLKINVRIILTTPAPMFLCWGNDLIHLYNDEYAHLIPSKHPHSLGKPIQSVWPEIWNEIIIPRIDFLKVQNSNIFEEAIPIVNVQDGHSAIKFTKVSYSPIFNEDGLFYGSVCSVWTEKKNEFSSSKMSFIPKIAQTRVQNEKALRESEAKLSIELTDAQTLQQISSSLIEEDNINALYGKILDAACVLMRAHTASIQKFDPIQNKLILIAHKGFTASTEKHWKLVCHDAACSCANAMSRNQRIVIPDIESEASLAGTKDLIAYRNSQIRATQSTPLISRSGRLIGVISTHWNKIHQPSTRELGLIDVLARQTADLIERFEAEETLRESEVRYRALVLANSGMLFQMNADWSEMIGFNSTPSRNDPQNNQKWLKSNWLETYVPSEEHPRVMAAIQQAIETKSVYELEHRIFKDNHEEGWVLSCAVPFLDHRGDIVEWFGALIDITKRKQVEHQLQVSHRRKDEFLAVLAHELRNPLVPIKTAIYLLQNNEQEGFKNKELIGMMERQVDHMVRLIDDLLEISRIATGKVELVKEPINLIDVIYNAVEVSRPLMDSNEQQLRLNLPYDSIIIHADMVRMTQVLVNLLNNAAKFTPKKGIITLAAYEKNHYISVVIEDNGIGISADMLPKVFDMFTQDKSIASSVNHNGLGIGLAMVHKLVELHGGEVKAYSAGQNQGSQFTVNLPFEKQYRKQIKPVHHPLLPSDPNMSSLRVLIVDDSLDILNSFTLLLNSWNIQTLAVENGRLALNALDQFNPHLILLDIGMPEMDGYAVAEFIRQNPKYAAIKLVALTGWGQKKHRMKSKTVGFDEHLTKPIDMQNLRLLLSKYGSVVNADRGSPEVASI